MIITDRIRAKKEEKKNALLNTAFKLFLDKGINNTSVDDITKKSGIAKGTFYLYFKDKYELKDVLIAKKSKKLFNDALDELHKNYITNFSDQIIFVINHVINALSKNTLLLKFISKNLSWGVYNETVTKLYEKAEKEENSIYYFFMKSVKENNIKLKNPDVTLYMIIELASSTCFNSILKKEPLPIEEFKPYLYDVIRNLLINT